MEILRRNSDYAIRGVLYLAKFYNSHPVRIGEISEKTKVPEEFLRKIFQKLERVSILGSVKGRRGGFFLKIRPQDLSLERIFKIIQGKIVINKCFLSENSCPFLKECIIHPRLIPLQEYFNNVLKNTTIDEFIKA